MNHPANMKPITYAEKLESEIAALKREIAHQNSVFLFVALYAVAVTTVLLCLLAYNYV